MNVLINFLNLVSYATYCVSALYVAVAIKIICWPEDEKMAAKVAYMKEKNLEGEFWGKLLQKPVIACGLATLWLLAQ